MTGRKIWLFVLFLLFSGCVQQQSVPSTPPVSEPSILATYVAQTLTALANADNSQQKSMPVIGTPSPVSDSNQPTIVAAVLNQTSTPAAAISSPTNQTVTVATSTPLSATATVTPTATVAPTSTSFPQPSQTATVSTSPTQSATNTPQGTPNADVSDCIDKAAFYADVTIPDRTLLPKNTDFVKTWRIKNVGTCAWGDGYKLVFAEGHILGGPPSSPLPKAAPGDLIDVSVSLKTPSDGGTYAGDWQFQNAAGRRFGVNSHGEDFFFVIIQVDWGPGVGPTPAPPPVNCAYDRNPSYEAQILQLINSARSSNNLPPLALQSQLSAAALAHSADMACNSYLDHIGSDKSNYSDRIKKSGYLATYDSENIYAGGNAQDAFTWWMDSKVHRDNILSNKITQIGIGFAYYAGSKFGGYYTLDFGRP